MQDRRHWCCQTLLEKARVATAPRYVMPCMITSKVFFRTLSPGVAPRPDVSFFDHPGFDLEPVLVRVQVFDEMRGLHDMRVVIVVEQLSSDGVGRRAKGPSSR